METYSEKYDVGIVGGGPKGLATHLECIRQGLSSVVIEAEKIGRSWEKDRMNNRGRVFTGGKEIVGDTNLQFVKFLESQRADYFRKNPLVRGLPSVKHFRDYLAWLTRNVTGLQDKTLVSTISSTENGFVINQCIKVKNLVLATGMTGYGGLEFLNDPTNLVGKSKSVVHSPTGLNTRAQLLEFCNDARTLTLIGSGTAALTCLIALDRYFNGQITVISSTDNFKAVEDATPKEVREKFSNPVLDALDKDRIHFMNGQRVTNVQANSERVEINTTDGNNQGQIITDKVIVAAGYTYDLSQISFMRELLPSVQTTPDGRLPIINRDFQVQGSETRELPIFIIGEGARLNGHEQRFLHSTQDTVERIANRIRSCI